MCIPGANLCLCPCSNTCESEQGLQLGPVYVPQQHGHNPEGSGEGWEGATTPVHHGAGERIEEFAPWGWRDGSGVKNIAVLPENLGLVPDIHMIAHNYL